ncbi:class I SAM-dependent methyltransferase [Oscillatoria amoena NRMC-F 0135]|nr:class I SAM-dependent methyltransferase [Oscillatoria amoena NRMC-F 0135]
MDLEQQIEYYDARWSNFVYANHFSLERCLFFLETLLETGFVEPKICDLGCGAGWLCSVLSAFGPTTGVELSPEAVKQAALRYPMAKFEAADATGWNPEAGNFDVVISQEVIEHIEDKQAYLRVAHQALRSGGYLLLSTPNREVLEAISPEDRKRHWEVQPVELPLNRAELNQLLAGAGFRVVRQSSAVFGIGERGWHRVMNSAKLMGFWSALGCGRAWRRWVLDRGYGMYLTTAAQKQGS